MDYSWKKELSDAELLEIENFWISSEYCAIEQLPQWHKIFNVKVGYSYFFARENNKLVCFCIINEFQKSFIKYSEIKFGPIFSEPIFLVNSLIEITSYYRKKNYLFIDIQLGINVSNISEYIEYQINKKIKVKYVFDRNNWSTLVINLNDDKEKIFKNFTKGHKSAIKKAEKEGLTVREINNNEGIDLFSQIYSEMLDARSLINNYCSNQILFKNILNFFNETKKGIILGVYDKENSLIGGIILLFQGNIVRYFKGAASPEKRSLPILHIAIWEGIKISKELDKKIFDLWGYNHFVNEKDQIYNINKFKKGFSTEYSFYPKIMHIELYPLGYKIFHLFKLIKLIKNKIFKK